MTDFDRLKTRHRAEQLADDADAQFIFVSQDFCNFQSGSLPEEEWKRRFAAARKAVRLALGSHDTVRVLSVVLSRIYTLRNQLIHGGRDVEQLGQPGAVAGLREPDGKAGAAQGLRRLAIARLR